MLTVLCLISVIWTISYVLLIEYLRRVWKRLPAYKSLPHEKSYHSLSIIIAARNEADNISECIHHISQNSYPIELYEIIVVDDHSTDYTHQIVKQISLPNLKIITQHSGKQGKKSALETGINQAKGDIIICTDADCVPGKYWLQSIESCFQTKAVNIVAAPVLPQFDNTLLKKFQFLDFAATMGITAVGLYLKKIALANGANIAYRKNFFKNLGAYQNNIHVASGDDIFLMQKALEYNPSGAIFLKSKDALVFTQPEKTWKNFFNQRRRWAAKTRSYTHHNMTFVQAFVFLFCLWILATLMGSIIFLNTFIIIPITMIFIKMSVDYFYLKDVTKYFGGAHALKTFVLSFYIYFFHIILSGWYAIFPGSYIWKDREVN